MSYAAAYEFRDYKLALKARAKAQRLQHPKLTLQELSGRVPMQYTYLSRVLNSKEAHLNEDQLFALAHLLEFLPDEIDFLQLLRAHSASQNSGRREVLLRKIEAVAKSKTLSVDYIESQPAQFNRDLYYLLNPMSIVVHASLFVKEIQKNPRQLCTHFGINVGQLKEILQSLRAADYIELDNEDPFKVTEVKHKRPHFSRSHPLIRAHQAMLKNLLQARLGQAAEADKESFMVTFTMDEKGLDFAREKFSQMTKELQDYSLSTKKHSNVYQMSFDLLRWL